MKSLSFSIIVTMFLMISDSGYGQGELSFDKIRIAGAASVELKQGENNSITSGDENSVPGTALYTVTSDGWLVVNGRKGDELNVTARRIRKIDIAGAGKLESDGQISEKEIDILVSGVGKVELDLQSEKVHASISGTGKIELKGSTNNLDIDISGAGKVDAEQLRTASCNANISGSGKCLLNVTDVLTTNISGSGSVYYVSLPATVNKNISGSGKVADANTNVQDTTKISFGKRKLLIVDEAGKNIRQGFKESVMSKPSKVKSHWAGFELGVNMLADSDYKTSAPEGYDFLKLKTGKSIAVNFNMVDFEIDLYRKNIMLVTGLGFTINNYRFKSQSYLLPGTDSVIAFMDPSVDVKKNKLVVNYITVPLLLEFNTSRNPDRTVHFAAGIIGGLRVGSHVKLVKEINGDNTKSKTRDDFNLNPWRYDATVRLGYRNFTVFGSYGLAGLFKNDIKPELNPVTVGVRLAGW